MKKALVLVSTIFVLLAGVQTASFADDAAKIRIKISGATADNRYFLCMSDLGCLSILAAERGKVYPIFNPIEMTTLYVTDAASNMRVSSQGLPPSCNVTVQLNQTITISGRISGGGTRGVTVNQLHCTVS